jgi:hypothetical protein
MSDDQSDERDAEWERTAPWRGKSIEVRQVLHAAWKFSADSVERRALVALADSIEEYERGDLPMPDGWKPDVSVWRSSSKETN